MFRTRDISCLPRCVCVLLLAVGVSTGTAQIREEEYLHLGVASCASSTCHGKITPQEAENVWLNEYRIWSTQDRHSRAFQTLATEESRRIAQKLGLPSAQTAKICLDCHADNVEPAKRGPRFQLSDGVSCEACHGGSELWIESHTEPGITHSANLERGMYATEDPMARAQICFSCHLGTANQFATHQIMGAGHPRLSFELEAFTANQPAHYSVDDDYRDRKGQIEGFNLWLVGQLQAAMRYLSLVKTQLYQPDGLFPELAFYDCHGCHHPMDDLRWSEQHIRDGIRPGSLRLQGQHLLMLAAVTGVLEPEGLEQLDQAILALVRAGQTNATAVYEAADSLLAWIGDREEIWGTRSYERTQVQDIRRTILTMAADGDLADFASAEQAFLALESLTLYLGRSGGQSAALDELFATVETDETYQPEQFSATARRILVEF